MRGGARRPGRRELGAALEQADIEVVLGLAEREHDLGLARRLRTF